MAACFQDYRHLNRVEHSVESLVAQRVYGLVQGYEDLNDHEQLRHDSMFALAVGKILGERQLSLLSKKGSFWLKKNEKFTDKGQQ